MLRHSWQTEKINNYLNKSQKIYLSFIFIYRMNIIVSLAFYQGLTRKMGFPGFGIAMVATFLIPLAYFIFSRDVEKTAMLLLFFFLISIIPGCLFGGLSKTGALIYMLFPVFVIFLISWKKGLSFISAYLIVASILPFLQWRGWIETSFPTSFMLLLTVNITILSFLALFATHRLEIILNRLEYHIYYDPLTGFFNRHKLINDLESGGCKALILVNTDNFKEMNDILGYRTGDRIIKSVGEVLHNNVSSKGIYRLSGSEFAVIQFLSREEDGNNDKRMMELVQSILFDMSQTNFQLNAARIPLSVSMGIALDRTGMGADLLSCCDLALQEGKRLKRKFCFYREYKEMADSERHMKWDDQIERAFEEDRIIPFYQPLIDNRTGKVIRYECLVRLIDNNGAVHLPAEFMDIVKKKRLYPRLTRTVFRHAVQTALERKIPISVNICEEDITDPFTREYFLFMLRQNDVGALIQFEILETGEIRDREILNSFLESMRYYGCKVAIDDFGSGYCNFDYLTEIKADIVKIDGALIREMDMSRDKRILVENIVSISRNLGIKTVAEYVNTPMILQIVKDLGIDFSQGNVLGEPIPFSSLSFSPR